MLRPVYISRADWWKCQLTGMLNGQISERSVSVLSKIFWMCLLDWGICKPTTPIILGCVDRPLGTCPNSHSCSYGEHACYNLIIFHTYQCSEIFFSKGKKETTVHSFTCQSSLLILGTCLNSLVLLLLLPVDCMYSNIMHILYCISVHIFLYLFEIYLNTGYPTKLYFHQWDLKKKKIKLE